MVVLAVGLLTCATSGGGSSSRLPLPHRVLELYDRFEEGVFGAVGAAAPAGLVVLTGLIWATEAMRLFLVVAGARVPRRPPRASAGAFFVALIGSLLTAVPLTPAGLGVVEAGVVGVLTLVYGVPPTEAPAITLVDRAISVLSIIVLGSIAYVVSPKRRGAGLAARAARSRPPLSAPPPECLTPARRRCDSDAASGRADGRRIRAPDGPRPRPTVQTATHRPLPRVGRVTPDAVPTGDTATDGPRDSGPRTTADSRPSPRSAQATMTTQNGRAFNEWLRAQLKAKKMSQRQLAQQSGVDHSTISRLIRGDRMPSLGTATKLARGLRELRDDADTPAVPRARVRRRRRTRPRASSTRSAPTSC